MTIVLQHYNKSMQIYSIKDPCVCADMIMRINKYKTSSMYTENDGIFTLASAFEVFKVF